MFFKLCHKVNLLKFNIWCFLFVFNFTFRLESGIADVDQAYRPLYIQYLLLVGGIALDPVLRSSLFAYFSSENESSSQTQTLDPEISRIAVLLEKAFRHHEEEIQYNLLQNFYPITLRTRNGISFQVSLVEYQRLRDLSDALAEYFPQMHSLGDEIRIEMPSNLLYVLIQIVSSKRLALPGPLPTASDMDDAAVHQLGYVIAQHVADHKILKFNFLKEISEVILDLSKLNGSNQILLREREELYDAISQLAEDYFILLTLSDPSIRPAERTRLIKLVYHSCIDIGLGDGDEQRSRFANQATALHVIKNEGKLILKNWKQRLDNVKEKAFAQTIDATADTLQVVYDFFEKHNKLILKIECERLAFVSAVRPYCHLRRDDEFAEVLQNLKMLVGEYRQAARNKAQLTRHVPAKIFGLAEKSDNEKIASEKRFKSQPSKSSGRSWEKKPRASSKSKSLANSGDGTTIQNIKNEKVPSSAEYKARRSSMSISSSQKFSRLKTEDSGDN